MIIFLLKKYHRRRICRRSILKQSPECYLKLIFIEAASGHGGGYRLTKNPSEYSISEILNLTEGSLAPVACLKDEQNTCERSSACYTLPIWEGLAKLINDYFDNMTLEDVAKVAIREQNDVTEAVSK